MASRVAEEFPHPDLDVLVPDSQHTGNSFDIFSGNKEHRSDVASDYSLQVSLTVNESYG